MTDTTVADALDDTARLILMDQPDISGPTLRRALRAEGFDTTLDEFVAVWRKYRGRTGFGAHPATHDVNTGRAL